MAAGLCCCRLLRLGTRLTRRPGGQPLVDLSLFALPSFTWGVVLAVVPILALLGILFTMPQYFQACSAPVPWARACASCPWLPGS